MRPYWNFEHGPGLEWANWFLFQRDDWGTYPRSQLRRLRRPPPSLLQTLRQRRKTQGQRAQRQRHRGGDTPLAKKNAALTSLPERATARECQFRTRCSTHLNVSSRLSATTTTASRRVVPTGNIEGYPRHMSLKTGPPPSRGGPVDFAYIFRFVSWPFWQRFRRISSDVKSTLFAPPQFRW